MRFSYGESPRTPPLEGTSLHRRNISVERPWGILSLFTTSLPLWVKSSHQSHWHVSPTQELIVCILRRQSSPIHGVLERSEPERRKAQYKKTHEKVPGRIRKTTSRKRKKGNTLTGRSLTQVLKRTPSLRWKKTSAKFHKRRPHNRRQSHQVLKRATPLRRIAG